jgi:hypothetical protein
MEVRPLAWEILIIGYGLGAFYGISIQPEESVLIPTPDI